MDPLVSVILPAYNSEKFIGRSLGSALAQSYRRLEVVVIDDGSTDRTRELVEEFADPRIRYLWQANAGQGPARNRGMRQCTGDYITFLDADDCYLPTKVEREVEFLERHSHYRVAYCGVRFFYSGQADRLLKVKSKGRSGNILPELMRDSFINPNAVMLAREVWERVGGFNETRYFPEEWELYLRIALAGYEFGFIDEDLVVVESRPGSNTTMAIQPQLKRNAIEMLERLMPKPVVVENIKCSVAPVVREMRLKLALAYLANGERREFLGAMSGLFGSSTLGYLAGLPLVIIPAAAVRALWSLNLRLRSEIVYAR